LKRNLRRRISGRKVMGGAIDRAFAAGLAGEVRQVIAGSKAVAVALEQDDSHRRIDLGLVERVGQSVIHGPGQRVLLLRPLQR
jgi:lipoate-protein ligase B